MYMNEDQFCTCDFEESENSTLLSPHHHLSTPISGFGGNRLTKSTPYFKVHEVTPFRQRSFINLRVLSITAVLVVVFVWKRGLHIGAQLVQSGIDVCYPRLIVLQRITLICTAPHQNSDQNCSNFNVLFFNGAGGAKHEQFYCGQDHAYSS